MATPSSELSLDYKPRGGFSASPTKLGLADQHDQIWRLEEFLARLEEERLKIEAFKRELPLCMQLLNNAMESYRQQLDMYRTSRGGERPVLEEFIPLKNTVRTDEKTSGASSEKASWMVSTQLWNPGTSGDVDPEQLWLSVPPRDTKQISFSMIPETKLKNGGAFLPFSQVDTKRSCSSSINGGSHRKALADLALGSPEQEKDRKITNNTSEENDSDVLGQATKKESYGNDVEKVVKGSGDGQPAINNQTHRKARRCWSPDLHRRFVNALQMLGGSQVATPKQIRELMKVDGLTNDEVKSHLQKYRLHTRRPIPPPQQPAAAAPQLVVLGGIWVPPEYATSATAAAAAAETYGSHTSTPAHYRTPPAPPEFYPVAPLPLRQPLPHRAPPYKDRHVSPDSDVRSGGGAERSESIEAGEEREEEDDEDYGVVDEEKAVNISIVPARATATEITGGGGGGGEVSLKF